MFPETASIDITIERFIFPLLEVSLRIKFKLLNTYTYKCTQRHRDTLTLIFTKMHALLQKCFNIFYSEQYVNSWAMKGDVLRFPKGSKKLHIEKLRIRILRRC